MGKFINFLRDIFNGVIDKRTFEYAIYDIIDILIDLNVDDNKMKEILAKKFDLRYSEIGVMIDEVKKYRSN